jgi:hypothetical protein
MSKFTIYEGEDFKAELEYNKDFLVLHLPEVTRFNRSTFMTMQVRLSEFNDFSKDMGYAAVHCAAPEDDQKLNKLATALGFVFLGSSQGSNVYEYKET